MNARLLLLIPLFLALLLLPGRAVTGSPDSFIITGADAVEYLDTVGSSDLNNMISAVATRIVVQAANQLRYLNMVPAPAELLAFLADVDDRMIIQAANANRYFSFAYPTGLIGDPFPPLISNLVPGSNGLIRWNTDEYCLGEVVYGTQSGSYPYNASSPLYTKQHQLLLPDLVDGTTYYFKVKSTDRSGNFTWSAEGSFVFAPPSSAQGIYLPLLRKTP
jgi:hypothetical protein